MTPEITLVAEGLAFPEGPIALPDGDVLLVEIAAGRLTRIAPDGRKSVVAEPGGGPNGAAIGPDGQCWLCNNGGLKFVEHRGGLYPIGQAEDYVTGRIERIDLATGRVERVYDMCGEHRLKAPNDIVFDRTGGFWFSDHGKTRRRDRDVTGVYYARPDGGHIVEAIFPSDGPNGVGLSPDESEVYVAETGPGRLWAYPLKAPGEIDGRKVPLRGAEGRLVAGLPGHQMFDSLAVDGEGHVCVATIHNGGITAISPDGARIEHFAMPDPVTTNICFGGPDLRTAYVTLSSTGRLVKMTWPRPGLALNFLNS